MIDYVDGENREKYSPKIAKVGGFMTNVRQPVRIDLSQFKLHIRIDPRTELTLHFDSPSRRFYLSVIGLVVYQMKNTGRMTTIPLEPHFEVLRRLNETVGQNAGSPNSIIRRIYRKWKDALPDLEGAPLFKVMGKRKEQAEGGWLYRFSDAEKDAWANLFEYKGSEQNVRLRFSLDRLNASLGDVAIEYEGFLDGEAWERFIADLGKDAPEPSIGPTRQRETSAPENPLYRRVFIGRQSEMSQLGAAFDHAAAGNGTLLMITGEPGIGKTTLWKQITSHVTAKGGITLVGHCHEESSLPYVAFVEALRLYVVSCPSELLSNLLGLAASDVARIVPEIILRTSAEPQEKAVPEEERYRLFQGVTDFLGSIARAHPLLLVLEDLHTADHGTLDMLRHVARFLEGKHLLIVGTYRDIEVNRTHPLSSALAELKRNTSYTRLHLRGLDIDEVRQMASALTGYGVTASLAEDLHHHTEGNPLFVQETVRYLSEQHIRDAKDVALRVPDGLIDVIGKRFSELSEHTNMLLAQASVIGRDFSLPLLEKVTDLPTDDVLAALEEARKAAIIEEHTGLAGAVSYRFTHALFRQALYEEIIAPRRTRLHVHVARAIEDVYSARLDNHLAELADHYGHSSDPANLCKAVSYGEQAAARAIAVYVYREAVRLLERALAIQEVVDPEDKAKRCDMLLALCEVLFYAGDGEKVVDVTAPEAYALAEALGDRVRASTACVRATCSLMPILTTSSEEPGSKRTLSWVERAERCAEPETISRVWADILRASCVSAKAVFVGDSAAAKEGVQMASGALELARRLNDPETLYWAFGTYLSFTRAPHYYEERLRITRDIPTFFSKPEIASSPWMPPTLIDVFLASGLREEAEEWCRYMRVVASRTGSIEADIVASFGETLLATVDGRLEEAAEISSRMKATVIDSGEMGFLLLAQMCAVTSRLLLGRTEEALTFANGRQKPHFSAYLGNHGETGQMLERLVVGRPGIGTADDVSNAPFDVALLEDALLVSHRKAVTLLLDRLNTLGGYATCFNWQICIGRILGMAAAFLDRPEDARRYYGQAMDLARKLRFRPEIALIRLEEADLLLKRYPDEWRTAVEHLDFATSEFRDMKMQPALERATRIMDSITARA
jgi:hypothetical protein